MTERTVTKIEALTAYIDGIQIRGYHVHAAVRLNDSGEKRLLRLARAASAIARVVKQLRDSSVVRAQPTPAPAIIRCLVSTNIIGNPDAGVRRARAGKPDAGIPADSNAKAA